MSVPLEKNGHVVYSDYILIEGISTRCLDSSNLVKKVLDYAYDRKKFDSCIVAEVLILSEVVDFNSGENLSQPASFFEKLVVGVKLDTLKNLPVE